jgi:hypothetical protein
MVKKNIKEKKVVNTKNTNDKVAVKKVSPKDDASVYRSPSIPFPDDK